MGPHFDYCMRAANNPSYFAIPSNVTQNSLNAGFDEVDRGLERTIPTGTNSLHRRTKNIPENKRIQFKTLLRTLSNRDNCVDPGFLKGQARSNDVAPECEREEIFYTIPLQGRRRHSVSGYLQSDVLVNGGNTTVTDVPCEVPSMPPPNFNKNNTKGTGTTESVKKKKIKNSEVKEMEDIAILSSNESPEAELWCEYLITCFDKIMSQRARHHYRVTSITAEDLITGCTPDFLQRIRNAQLQIIIMCPRFESKMKQVKQESGIMFKGDKALVMLLGVEKEYFINNNIEEYSDISSWYTMTAVEQDPSFVDSLLTSAVSILRANGKDCKDVNSEKTSFSVLPKKVKVGQSRVIALLNDPLKEEDSIKIIFDRKGEQIAVQGYRKRNPYTLQFDVPECCLEVSMLIWIKITKNGQSLGRRQIKCESRLRELDQILRASDNPLQFMCQTLGFKTTDREQLDSWMLASFQKNVPSDFHLLSSNDQYNPKAEIHSSEEYPTLLHFAAAHGLERLCWRLLECAGADVACSTYNIRRLTPAGLASSAGHNSLAMVLRSHAQMNEFSNMYYYLKNMTESNDKKNKSESTKIDTAELKIVEPSDFEYNDKTEMPNSDPFSNECLQSLESVNEKHNELYKEEPKTPLSPTCNNEQLYQNDLILPTQKDHIQQAIEHDYLFQPSNIKVEEINFKIKPEHFIYSPSEENKSFISTPSSGVESLIFPERAKSVISNKSSKERGGPLSGQEELAEIINDFKNNVFTISEVEKLVNDWRRRHETRQSIREKKEQLDKMRLEYDRLQKNFKDKLKRPTPFERVKKMFSKKNKSIELNDIEKRSGNRPNSSMSETSSSSGRLSTVSGGSLGESSLPSEIDDKRISSTTTLNLSTSVSNSISDVSTRLDDYLIPPPPRPVTASNFNGYPITLSTFGHPKVNQMETIVERDTMQDTHMILNFDNNSCRKVPQIPKLTNSHLYMNVSPSSVSSGQR